VLSEWGIEVPMLNCMNHLDLHVIILANYFTFEKQDLFYYQWYADYIHDKSLYKRSEYVNFYKFKNIHETMESRQAEGYYSRRAILNERHWDYKELLKSVYHPTFTNIMDPKNNLITEPEKFNQYFAWFMKQFHPVKPILPESWKLNHEVSDLQRFFFFYRIDFSQDKDLLRAEGYPIDIDRKFNNLVFRCRHVLEDVVYEVFEMTYDLPSFQD
jgi:hypothetical protein